MIVQEFWLFDYQLTGSKQCLYSCSQKTITCAYAKHVDRVRISRLQFEICEAFSQFVKPFANEFLHFF